MRTLLLSVYSRLQWSLKHFLSVCYCFGRSSGRTDDTLVVTAATRKVHHSNSDADMVLHLMYACSLQPQYLYKDAWGTK